MTYSEHMAWCKRRALAYLDQGDVRNAMLSLMSDFGKDESTRDLLEGVMGSLLLAHMNAPVDKAREFIKGYPS